MLALFPSAMRPPPLYRATIAFALAQSAPAAALHQLTARLIASTSFTTSDRRTVIHLGGAFWFNAFLDRIEYPRSGGLTTTTS